MHTDVLAPNVDQRIQAWLESNRNKNTDRPNNKCITLAREFGCEGYVVAEKIKEILEVKTGEIWNVFDKQLLEKVHKDANISEEILRDLGDPSYHFDTLATLIPNWTSHSEAFHHVMKTILQLAEGGNCVIVGRGGAYITQNFENCYHFRLEAPESFRIDSIARRMSFDKDKATELVRANQQSREQFISDYFKVDITSSDYYDMIFNNHRVASDVIARVIADYTLSA